MTGAGLKEILLVSGTEHMGDFVELLGSGREYDCRLTYRVQDEAGGIAQALGLAELFCTGSRCVVILGDNIFYDSLRPLVAAADKHPDWAWVAIKRVPDPGRYGVAELANGRVLSIEEKPAKPKSDYAVAGIYIYPADVFEVIRTLRPSARGELEITDVNRYYLSQGRLGYTTLEGYWTDAGTLDSLDVANELVRKQPPVFA
jgi:glucose-1-phosphate thymidylyltransferase